MSMHKIKYRIVYNRKKVLNKKKEKQPVGGIKIIDKFI